MTLTIDLPEKELARLNEKAGEAGIAPEEYARRVLERDLEAGEAKPRRHIADKIREIWADLPEEVLAQLPADGASQHNHYIYGLPKREE
jgi:hypothetical protein